MKKNILLRCTLKYLPLYIFGFILLFINQYIISLISVFIGEVLSIFAGEEHILPDFIAKYINNESTYTQITSLCTIFVITAVIVVISRLIQNFSKVYAARKIEVEVSQEFFYHVLKLPKNYLVTHPTGDIIQRNIQDTQKYVTMLNQGIWWFGFVTFSIISVFIQIYNLSFLNFILGLLIIGVVILFGIIFSFVYIRKKEIASSEFASKVDSRTQQSFTNISMVKTFANEDEEKDKFNTAINELEETKFTIQKSYSNYWRILDIVSTLYNAITTLVVGILYLKGSIGLGAATSLIILNSSIVDQSSGFVSHINAVLRNSVSIKRLNEYFNQEEDYVIDGTLTPEIDGDIEFNNVTMAYQDDLSTKALKNISFKVKQGETIGIVGKSGSGKTTLINVLTRLDDYQEGSITINGVELKDIKKKHLRENLSIVNQESFIFAKTIKENLTILSKKEVNIEDYVDRVCLTEDIAKMDEGYETIVGERGVTLSGGQRQRIAIARALVKNKRLLILDDSLSALDNNVAKKIKSELKKNNCTTFIISHNLMNIMDADNIIVLEDGAITQMGKHNELIKVKGLYNDIWNLQQGLKVGDDNE